MHRSGRARGLFDAACPLALPRDIGISVLLTSPAFLLALAAFSVHGSRRLVLAAATAILLVTIANLMHFSQGWVQFGYRFRNPWSRSPCPGRPGLSRDSWPGPARAGRCRSRWV